MLIFHFLIVGLIDQHAYTIFYSATSDFSLDTSFAKISNQNRRQKVFNRGALRLLSGAWHFEN